MDKESGHWRDSSTVNESTSIVISDSDDDIVDNVEKEKIFVVESSEGSTNVSQNVTPEKSKLSSSRDSEFTEEVVRHKIKKYIPLDSDDDGDSDSNESSSTSSAQGEDDNVYEITSNDEDTSVEEHHKRKRGLSQNKSHKKNETQVEKSEESEESEAMMSLAKEEVGVGNIDPLAAQKRALLVCKLDHLRKQLNKTQLLLVASNVDFLPDKGEKLRENIAMQEEEIKLVEAELNDTPLTKHDETEWSSAKRDPSFTNEEFNRGENFYDLTEAGSGIPSKQLGRMAQATLEKETTLTAERIQALHGSLVSRPSEDERAEDPKGLKVKLMPHQQHALAWLMWREQQKPPGGVLADDMGLGKTLTMISLIIASIAKKELDAEDESSEEESWSDRRKTLRYKGGTLVVCPASLLSQWENEIHQRCKRGMLSVEVHHGSNRETAPKRLAKNDVVITTYNIVAREFKTMSTVFKIRWERIVLDEAHTIRNHKSKGSESVCELVAKKRWALTGTPIQNKELDLYSILKFLKCSPFDDLRVWKRWVDNKNAAGRQRLATVMKALMLRRTKQELQDSGALDSLPEKFIEEIFVQLDPQEQLVYEKVLIYSRTLFAQFLAQRAEKDHMSDLAGGRYDKPSFLSNPNKNTQFTKAQQRLLSLHADVKSHEILVLLLRLRQICIHPALINSMLDQEGMEETGLTDMENFNPDVLEKLNRISLYDTEESAEKDIGVDHRVASNVLTSKNPVFNYDRVSSKMRVVLDTIKNILEKNDKLIVVSQWTNMLKVVASCLPSIKGATFSMFTGEVPIKERQGIMDSFNAVHSDPRILLLSLTAGGVGLNLVGGNHLLLIDIHWNPQLEVQAQDRIYRFGQKKNVFIYKFICKNTIEERIRQLQEKKMEIAENVLTGNNSSIVSKLTLDDLKSLFAL